MKNNKWEKKLQRYKNKKKNYLIKKEKYKFLNMKKIFRPIIRFGLSIQRKINGFSVEIMNEEFTFHNKPTIFAVTHIGKWDFEIVNEQIQEQFYVIAADYKNLSRGLNGIILKANGIVYVDERDKTDKTNTKEMMVRLLRDGANIMIFPEGTWNLSENSIVNDIAYGAAYSAIETGASICPIAIEQYDKRFVINMGKRIEVADKNTNKKKINRELRDTLATLKWQIWEQEGLKKRSDISDDYWKNFIEQRRREWEKYSLREQIINTYIPDEKWQYWITQIELKTNNIPTWLEILKSEEGLEWMNTNDNS